MKLLVLSDLHVEFAPFEPSPEALTADVVVLAGDIDVRTRGIAWARQRFPNQEIIYVMGNHELYRGEWDETPAALQAAAQQHGIHFLEDAEVTLFGVRFLGACLWTDFEFFGIDRRTSAMRAAQVGLTDYELIRAVSLERRGRYDSLLTPAHTLKRHVASRAWLEGALVGSEPESTVVVTHHYPHRLSTAPAYAHDELTAAFGSQLPEELITRASLWIHGHTHTSFDYTVEALQRSTRVVCNPRGYPRSYGGDAGFENDRFDPSLLVEFPVSGGASRE